MSFLDQIFAKLARHPKRVVFPEGSEPRVLVAAREFAARGLGAPILLGPKEQVQAVAERQGIDLARDRISHIDPATSSELPGFCERFELLERYKHFGVADARQLLLNPNYFAAMMIQHGQADALVGGAGDSPAANVLRPLLQLLKPLSERRTVFGCTILEAPGRPYGDDGTLFLADCAVIPEPDVEQLANIAVHTATLCCRLGGGRARVAMLSFSSKGSSASPAAARVSAATTLARKLAAAVVHPTPPGVVAPGDPGMEIVIDGELQADTALDPVLAARKAPGSTVAGQANVLVFPDLNSGNIASKLIALLADTRSYGQILLGLSRPAAELSRGATAETILGVAAIVGVQASEYRTLYPPSHPITPLQPS